MKMYSKLSTEFYDLEEHPRGDQALSFYMQHAHQVQGLILEPMCGSGRFLIPMLRAGLQVEGFDASSYMLDAFKQKYAQESMQAAPVWQQFVQDFNSDKRYKLIFIPYGSLGLIIKHEDLKKSLEVMRLHLAPGGKFIVEIETVASVPQPCGVWRRAVNTRPDGAKIALNFVTSYKSEAQMFQSRSRYELIVDGTVEATEEEIFQQYLYRVDELDKLLFDVGFTNVKKYPAFDDTKIVNKDTSVIIYECMV
jgi:SAM-dependent methyltransferase